MVLTNAEIRPRPRPVSAITPDTPLHEVAINTWMCVERMVTPRQRRWRMALEKAAARRASLNPHFSNYWRIGPPNQAKVVFARTTCADLEGQPDADGV